MERSAGLVDFAGNGEREVNPGKLRLVVETFSDPRYRLGRADVQADFLGRAYEYLCGNSRKARARARISPAARPACS